MSGCIPLECPLQSKENCHEFFNRKKKRCCLAEMFCRWSSWCQAWLSVSLCYKYLKDNQGMRLMTWFQALNNLKKVPLQFCFSVYFLDTVGVHAELKIWFFCLCSWSIADQKEGANKKSPFHQHCCISVLLSESIGRGGRMFWNVFL